MNVKMILLGSMVLEHITCWSCNSVPLGLTQQESRQTNVKDTKLLTVQKEKSTSSNFLAAFRPSKCGMMSLLDFSSFRLWSYFILYSCDIDIPQCSASVKAIVWELNRLLWLRFERVCEPPAYSLFRGTWIMERDQLIQPPLLFHNQ